jgi:acetyl-CoA acyltransferase
MRDAVIVEAVRAPIGKFNGALSSVHPVDLSAHALSALVERSGIDPAVIDDVQWGCVSQVGEQALDIGRNAAIAAGYPLTVTGMTIDRQCGSSQQAVSSAAATVIAGYADVVVAGGVESMSRARLAPPGPEGWSFGSRYLERFPGFTADQMRGAEMVAEKWGITREQCDEFSLVSHVRAAAAQDNGNFDAEIAPLVNGAGEKVTRDEGVRRGSTLEKLAALQPVTGPGGLITAGNASQVSDGTAALLVTTSEKARELGLTPLVRLHTSVTLGDDPVMMLNAPIPATYKALKKSGLTLDDIGAYEVNEAFATIALAWLKDTGADPERMNPNGGAIALGHPLGGSGARIMTTLIHHMRSNGIRYGLQTMCEGGGQANVTILELV